MQYKDEFYLIDTLEKAYMLGLLQADGAMLINNRAQSVCTKLKLKAEDKYLLQNLNWKYIKVVKNHIIFILIIGTYLMI